jgi:hypothetical protein
MQCCATHMQCCAAHMQCCAAHMQCCAAHMQVKVRIKLTQPRAQSWDWAELGKTQNAKLLIRAQEFNWWQKFRVFPWFRGKI